MELFFVAETAGILGAVDFHDAFVDRFENPFGLGIVVMVDLVNGADPVFRAHNDRRSVKVIKRQLADRLCKVFEVRTPLAGVARDNDLACLLPVSYTHLSARWTVF